MLNIRIHTLLSSGATADISGDSPEEVHRALVYLHNIGQLGAAQPDAEPEPNEHSAPAQGRTDAPAAEPAPKRSRKPKAETAAKEEPKATEPAAKEAPKATEPAAKEAPKSATKEDAAAAVTELANAKGLKAAKELLAAFSVKRAGELSEHQLDLFVADARKLIEAQDAPSDDANDLV